MLQFKSLFIIACILASTSLFSQPSIDIILLTAPSITETMDQVDVAISYVAPVNAADEAHVLTPSGNVAVTDAGKLAEWVDDNGQIGTYRFYFPLTGLRTKLIVE